MTRLTTISLSGVKRTLNYSLSGLLLLIILSSMAAAQSTTAVDGYTPLGLSPGAPAGSYGLSGFENVNLFNGNLNFSLPMLNVGGRGGAAHQITRPIERKWIVEQFHDEAGDFYSYFPSEPVQLWANPDYGAGMLTARYAHWGTSNCPRPDGTVQTAYDRTLTRLTFTAPGGTQYELRDQQTNGQYYTVPSCPASGSSYNRGKIFITSDGTFATFISDTDITEGLIADDPNWYADPYDISGYLLLRDGTRYRIEHGVVGWIRDRNGNKVTWSNGIIDPLNRKVTITYQSAGTPYDEIRYKGFGGMYRTIRINYTPLGSALRMGYSLQTPKQLFPELDGSSTTNYDPQVIRSIILPDGRSYTFSYNSYGELARVVLPTGGAIEYDYAAGLTSGNASGTINFGLMYGGGAMDWQIYRRVIERRTYANGTTLESRTTFSRPESAIGSTLGYVVVDQMNAAGTLLARQKHYFYGSAADSLDNTGIFASIAYPGWKEGREWKTETLDDDGTTVLKRVEHTWQQPVAGSTWPLTQPETGSGAKPNNPQITQTVNTLVDTNQVTKQTFTYDQFNNQTNVYEYNYGTGAAGTLIRRTSTTYVTTNVVGGITYNYQTDAAIHLRSLPKQTSVYDAAGIEQSRTTIEYDNYTATANHAGLVARTGISGLDAAFTTSYGTRGNATAATRYLLTNGAVTSSISTYQQYDVAGSILKNIDGLGNQTTFTFADCFGSPDAEARLNSGAVELGTQYTYAFPSLVTDALLHTTYSQYDYYTGKAVDVEDSNGMTLSVYYNDDLDRPTQVIRAADDTALRSQTTYSYDDANHIVTTTSDLDAFNDTTPLKSQTLYDGMGRTTETRSYETATAYVTIKRTYDALGRPSQMSNPYRAGQTIAWSTSTYDALGRVTFVTTPDNAVVSTTYSGNTVTVTDQAGKDRQRTTDALGRLTQVIEDPGTGGLNYSTTYVYDVLGNLKSVTQGSQTRTFTYDSLSRLKSAANPESGTVSYSYDNNSNLTQKTDARSISTNFTYDQLNRVTLKNYSDVTPDVRYFYDAQTLPAGAPVFDRGSSIGRLVAVTTGGTSAGSYYGYDALGQTLRRIQQTDSVNYLVDATYNKAGAMTGETYPQVPGHSGRRTVSYSFDTAGRLSSLATAATTYATGASVTGISYAAHGGLSSETLGNNLVHALSYNNRLQPTQIKLGTTTAPTSILNLSYNYGTTNNNGNVLDVTNTVGAWTTKQIHTYDVLNRLDSTAETNGSTTTYWTEDEAYDRYGNRWEVNAGIPSLTFNAANNRISSAGYVYDAAGNLTNDTVHTYGYDAENRIKSVDGVANSYQYDGESKRVRKYFPLGEQVRFVYGIKGQLVAEFETASGAVKKEYVYGSNGLLATIEPSNGTRYTTADHLGTPRVLTSSTGAVVSRRDYQPFGEELGLVGGRTTQQGYIADNARQKFTGKERDSETGLDYFGARYYASSHGRFTSRDAISSTKYHVVNPQKWNAYSYVLNNPLILVDPDGNQEEGKGGAKTIDVFLVFSPDARGQTKEGKPNPPPDWKGLSNKDYKVRVFEQSESTAANIAKSTANSDVVVIIGDAQGNMSPDRFTATSISATGNRLTENGVELDTLFPDAVGGGIPRFDPKPEVNAGVLCVVTCNSMGLSNVFTFKNPDTVFVGNDGGSDGQTAANEAEWGGFVFVRAIVNGATPEEAKDAANEALQQYEKRYPDNPHSDGDQFQIKSP